jgi:hypothetical protein
MPRGWPKRELENELVRILFDGRVCLVRVGILPGDANSDGRRGSVVVAPEEFVACPEAQWN